VGGQPDQNIRRKGVIVIQPKQVTRIVSHRLFGEILAGCDHMRAANHMEL
jgi:hypothetical protein